MLHAPTGDCDVGAEVREAEGDRFADTGPAPGDESGLAGQQIVVEKVRHRRRVGEGRHPMPTLWP